MPQGPREGRPALLLATLMVALFALMAGQVRYGPWSRVESASLHLFSPLLRGVRAISSGFAELGSRITGAESPGHVRDLEERVARLELELQRREDQRLENVRLRALLGMEESLPFPAVAASVLANSARGTQKTFLIDRGSAAGLRPNLPVVNAQGVVGRVWTVGRGLSKVQMLIDAASGVATVVQRTRVQGVLVGRGDQLLELRYISALDEVAAGDLLLTSGQDGIYPRGLPVGVVADVREMGALELQVTVVPRVEFNRLEEILVLTGAGLPEEGEDLRP